MGLFNTLVVEEPSAVTQFCLPSPTIQHKEYNTIILLSHTNQFFDPNNLTIAKLHNTPDRYTVIDLD